jgi:hypothetical protein
MAIARSDVRFGSKADIGKRWDDVRFSLRLIGKTIEPESAGVGEKEE